jgi:hypothetical protein
MSSKPSIPVGSFCTEESKFWELGSCMKRVALREI